MHNPLRTGLTLAATLATTLALTPPCAVAADVTLRVHHFLPPMAPAQTDFIEPWAERVQTESEGRIEVQIFPSMQLGGRPPQLYDQVRDGVADVVWTVLGYTPGRFPTMEVFELPFMPASAEATSQATQAFYESQPAAQEDFGDIHPLAFFTHAPGLETRTLVIWFRWRVSLREPSSLRTALRSVTVPGVLWLVTLVSN